MGPDTHCLLVPCTVGQPCVLAPIPQVVAGHIKEHSSPSTLRKESPLGFPMPMDLTCSGAMRSGPSPLSAGPELAGFLTLARERPLLLEKPAQHQVHHKAGLVRILPEHLGQLLQIPLDVLVQESYWVTHWRPNDVP